MVLKDSITSSMSVHPLITNSLIVAVLDSLLYGVFLLLNAFCTSLFIRRYKSNSTEDARSYWFKNPMIVGALSLFICVTGHWTCTIFDFFQGFVAFKGGTQPVEYYDDPSRPSRIARVAFLSLSVLIADGMMVYRLWIVWSFNILIIIFPCITLLGYLVTATGTLLFPLINGLSTGEFLVKGGKPWVLSQVVFIVLTNVYSTALIAFRIWAMNKEYAAANLGTSKSNRLTCIFVIFIESAFIYCAWGFIFIVALACGKQAGSVFSDTYPTIAGIAFALISARVGAESARRSNRIQSFTNPISRVHFETFQSTRDHESGLGPAYSMQVHESQGNSQMDPREIGYGTQAQQKNGRAGL